MKEMQNLYEVRKSLRFELKPVSDNIKSLESNKSIILDDFGILILKHKKFINLLSETLFYKEVENLIEKEEKTQNVFGKFFSENNIQVSENINNNDKQEDFSEYEIYKTVYFKYGGVQKIFKSEWIENKKDITLQKKYGDFVIDEETKKYKKQNKNYMTMGTLGNKNFIRPYFEKILIENLNSNDDLEKLNRQENLLARKSDIFFEIQKLNSRDLLGNLYILFEGGYLDHKNDVNIIKELKNQLSEIKEFINDLLLLLKPSQSFGVVVDNISLNYYTRKKTPKDYDEEIIKKEVGLEKKYNGKLGELYGIDENQGIKELYEEMKTFKANQKSAFVQLLQNKTNYEEFKNLFLNKEDNNKKYFTFTDNKENEHKNFELKLFDDISKENYEKILTFTNKIEKESDKKEITKLKEKRGKHFMSKYSCANYINFCNEYKQVAMEYGDRRALFLSLQREQIESQKERGWGIISTDGKNHFLNTISIKNTEKANKIFQNEKYREQNDIKYYIFSSITLRALEKLCFKKESKFISNIMSELSTEFKVFVDFGEEKKYILNFEFINESEKNKINFLNNILENQDTLGIIYRDSKKSKDILKDSKTIDEFEINLKKETYILDTYFMSKIDFEENIKKIDGKIYEITSWDLKKERQKPEFQTKTWLEFWSKENKENKFPIRINPEINIGYIEKNETWQKEEKNKNQTNNRRNRNRFLMMSTVSYKSDKKYINNAFIKDGERIDNIQKFNEKFNEKNKYDYFYGLDKGVLELATLGIYKKIENKIEFVELDKVNIYKITKKGFTISKEVINKNGDIKTHYLKNNPSIFIEEYINDNAIFEKLNITSCIGDLSCAKVIKGNIILNADINTYNKLQEINIKRLLYKTITEGKCISDIINYDKEKNIFSYTFENRGKNEERKISCHGKNVNIEIFEKDINSYMQFVREKNSDVDVSITKINNLKNAICANMVGVIIELQKEYPGFIVWENIDNAWVDREVNKGNIVIGNLINEKIYNKLQITNDVPPVLKKFRSEIDVNTQHGKVTYIDKKDTSTNCIVCGNKLFGHLEGKEWEYRMHHCDSDCSHKYKKGKKKDFLGNNCTFYLQNPDFSEFNFIKSGDDLATYNIAKKGLEYIKNLN